MDLLLAVLIALLLLCLIGAFSVSGVLWLLVVVLVVAIAVSLLRGR